MELNQKRRTKKRLPERLSQTLEMPAQMNHTWSFDFMSDSLHCGRWFRVLNVINEGTREALEILVDSSLPAARVVQELEQIKFVRDTPKRLRVDKGPETLAQVFTDLCKDKRIELAYIQCCRPNQNAFIERFSRSYRNELLDPYLFTTLTQVREMTSAWMISYNEERKHDPLGRKLPAELRRQITGEAPSFSLCA